MNLSRYVRVLQAFVLLVTLRDALMIKASSSVI